jgi:DNA-binding NtrC family response regulator
MAVPPLAERPEDVVVLADAFLAELPAAPGGEPWQLSEAARECLLRHPWPGNVRELGNVLRRATLVAPANPLRPRDLGLAAQPSAEAGAPPRSARPSTTNPLLAAERARIERALAEAGGVVAQAAEALGLSRQALYRRMEKHGLAVERQVRG